MHGQQNIKLKSYYLVVGHILYTCQTKLFGSWLSSRLLECGCDYRDQ